MSDPTCTRCGVPHGATIYRRQFSLLWTSSVIDASRDPRYGTRPLLVSLNEQGLCQHCAPKLGGGR